MSFNLGNAFNQVIGGPTSTETQTITNQKPSAKSNTGLIVGAVMIGIIIIGTIIFLASSKSKKEEGKE